MLPQSIAAVLCLTLPPSLLGSVVFTQTLPRQISFDVVLPLYRRRGFVGRLGGILLLPFSTPFPFLSPLSRIDCSSQALENTMKKADLPKDKVAMALDGFLALRFLLALVSTFSYSV